MKLNRKLIHLNITVKFANIEQGKEKECRFPGGHQLQLTLKNRSKCHMGYITGIWIPDLKIPVFSMRLEHCILISCKYSGTFAVGEKAQQASVRNKH